MKKTLKRTTLFLTALLLLILSAISTPRQSFAENQYPEIYFSDEYTAEPYNDGDYCLKYTFRLYMPSFIDGVMTEHGLGLEIKSSVITRPDYPSVIWINNSGIIHYKQELELGGDLEKLYNKYQYQDLNKVPAETNYALKYDASKDMYYVDIPIAVHRSCTDIYIYAFFKSTNQQYLSKANSPTVYWMDDVYDYIDDVYRTEMQEQVANLQAQIETKNNEINNLNSQIATLNGQIVELQNDILELGQEYSAELEAKQNEYNVLLEQKATIETMLEDKKQELATVKSTLNMTETEYLETIRAWENKVRDLNKENSELKDENEELKKQLEKTQTLGCSASVGATLPVMIILLSGLVIMGRIIYARKKEKI